MQSANFVTIVGVISRESKTFGEYNRLHLTVAGTQQVGERDTTFFQQVRAGGDEGKFAAMIPEGTPVVIKGTLRHESWDKDGIKQYATYVKANAIRQLPNPQDYLVEQKVSPAGAPYYVMPGYVSVTAEGNLGKDPELRHTQNGLAVLGGSFACKEEWIQNGEAKEHTNWLNFTVWGDEAARLAEQGISKGWSIAVIDGIIRTSSSVSNGKTYQNTSIEAGGGRMTFLPKRGAAGGGIDIDALMAGLQVPAEDLLPF